MVESVNPTLLNRISALARPDFVHTVRARRIAAGLLVVLAAVAAWRPDPGDIEVVVALRELQPGIPLTPEDVGLRARPAGTLPDGAVTTVESAIGAMLTGPIRRGEVLTDARTLGTRAAELSAGPHARNVPLHLADAAVLDLIRPGDVVDVLGAPSGDATSRARVLAVGAVVVLVSPAGPRADQVVLIALPEAAATAVAAASLTQEVTLMIH
jgi:Flp pilus assembly protein CpaB